MKDKAKGLYNKYHVMRMDYRDLPGEKHEGCRLFVLDITHDPHAIPAIRAYADSCRADYPVLAADLDAVANQKARGSGVSNVQHAMVEVLSTPRTLTTLSRARRAKHNQKARGL